MGGEARLVDQLHTGDEPAREAAIKALAQIAFRPVVVNGFVMTEYPLIAGDLAQIVIDDLA
ncbi:MAG: hypothetical protein GYB64_02090 [Chloroflexi bacterium]|nr:hypothetical protein [Chloroflexota bacterium]